MEGSIGMEQKGCESIGCYTHFVTFNFYLNHNPDLVFSRSNFEKVLSQGWDGLLTWDERDVNGYNVGPMLWLSMFTSPKTLTLVFQGHILKRSHLRNGMADWHGIKGMWVDRIGPMLWLSTFTSPMTLTLDFQGEILKFLYVRNGRVDLLGMKGMWVGYDVGCTMGLTLVKWSNLKLQNLANREFNHWSFSTPTNPYTHYTCPLWGLAYYSII